MSRGAGAGSGRLARLGFDDPERAGALLGAAGLGWWDAGGPVPGREDALAALVRAADPDLALLALHRLDAAQPDTGPLRHTLLAEPDFRTRLVAVLGASIALGDHLVANSGDWRLLTEDAWDPERPSAEAFGRTLLDAVGVPAHAPPTWGSGGGTAWGAGAEVVADLRQAYRRALLCVAARDLTTEGQDDGVAGVARELADLAGATLRAALAVAAAELPADALPVRLAVVGMGKCGGRELNYLSDVDVVFVAEPGPPPPADPADDTDTGGGLGSGGGPAEPGGTGPRHNAGRLNGGPAEEGGAALRTATVLAATTMRICSAVAWQVDAALRPEGRDGPLVRSVASHQAYYRQWAKTWEFQALLKARPLAGDAALGAAWTDAVTPLVWGDARSPGAAARPGAVAEVRAMRRRVERSLPLRQAAREIKLGPGGLRDIEFAVQLLQLVHGRGDTTLRSGTTLDALRALIDGGYVGREDGEALDRSYRFLRTIEHRLQLQRLHRTHRLPDDSGGLRWLAHALGYRGNGDPVEAFTAEWTRHAHDVRRLHEKLFYRPLLEAVAAVPGEELRLSPEAARARLEVLGFDDPAGALRHLEALTAGVSRRAHIQRNLLPAMLGSFADAPDPDGGLLAYRRVSDQLGSTPWFLRLVRDEGLVATRLPVLLATSRYVADLLARDPEGLRLLAEDAELRPRPAGEIKGALAAAVGRHPDPADAVIAARAVRRRELLRTAFADLLGLVDALEVGRVLTDLTEAVLAAALEVAHRVVSEGRGGGGLPMRLAVVGMGRFGGAEMSYSSDADVLFVYEAVDGAPDGEAAAAAGAVAEELRRLLAVPAPDPPLGVDANLRPEGRRGPLVRSLASYAEYYRRWSSGWEAQALLRARPVAGDRELAERFLARVDPLRYPAGGLPAAAVTEVRRIKARVDTERLPRGADPATHTKLGRGGLADVEWTVQLLQLRHAGTLPGLRTPRTLDALTAARDAGLVTPFDHDTMAAAWTRATEVRNALMLVRGRPSDQLPRHGLGLAGVIRALGRPPGTDPGAFLDEYLRTMRHGRQAVEKVFYA